MYMTLLQSMKKDYIEARRKREEFRKKLVDLILIKEDEGSSLRTEFPSEYEKQFLRYHYYIRHGADTLSISPINPEWVANIRRLLPLSLRKNTKKLDKLLNELKVVIIIIIMKVR